MKLKEALKNKRIYVIAEIGGNFTTFEEAKSMIDAAKECDCDGVKLQTYRAETLTSRKAMFEFETTGHRPQFEMFQSLEIDKDLHEKIFDYSRQKGIEIFSTPSHMTDVEMLEQLNCPIYKIGSDDAVNIPFLRGIARLKKSIILATGMCTLDEVEESVNAILEEGCSDIFILHAISLYPTHPEDVNLNAILDLKRRFPNIPVGYSDHTLGSTACICAAAMGAEIIEKHFTYDKNADGPDHIHSADPKEMQKLVSMIRDFEVMRGTGVKMPAPGELVSRINNRKSIVLNRDIKSGERLTDSCFDLKRPGSGIQPKDIKYALVRTFIRDMQKEDIVMWEDLG